ncbi:MAG: nitroreductase family protein [Lachnospiraceae bacterium]|nr:nitroreductase family protein [Lachnospiraceae bacterium]
MDLLETMLNRRSVRKYTKDHIPGEVLQQIIEAGLAAPTGRGKQEWEFIIVQTRKKLDQMAKCRNHGSSMLMNADCAIVVLGDELESDVWTEDCSIAMAYMHLMADSLGVGSCWIQGRNRVAEDGRTTEEYLRELLGFPKTFRLEAILSLGMPEEHPMKRHVDQLPMDHVHMERY